MEVVRCERVRESEEDEQAREQNLGVVVMKKVETMCVRCKGTERREKTLMGVCERTGHKMA